MNTNHAFLGVSATPPPGVAVAVRFWLRWDHRGLHRWWPPWASQPWRHRGSKNVWASHRWSWYSFLVKRWFKALQFQCNSFGWCLRKDPSTSWTLAQFDPRQGFWVICSIKNGIFFSSPTFRKLQQIHPWNMVHVVVVVIEIPTKRNSFHLFLPYDSMAVIKFYIFYMGFLDKSWQILIEAPCIPARPAALESAALLTASAPPMLGTPGDAWNCMRTFWWFTSSTAQGGGSSKDRKI